MSSGLDAENATSRPARETADSSFRTAGDTRLASTRGAKNTLHGVFRFAWCLVAWIQARSGTKGALQNFAPGEELRSRWTACNRVEDENDNRIVRSVESPNNRERLRLALETSRQHHSAPDEERPSHGHALPTPPGRCSAAIDRGSDHDGHIAASRDPMDQRDDHPQEASFRQGGNQDAERQRLPCTRQEQLGDASCAADGLACNLGQHGNCKGGKQDHTHHAKEIAPWRLETTCDPVEAIDNQMPPHVVAATDEAGKWSRWMLDHIAGASQPFVR
jgi:hypothetical protein